MIWRRRLLPALALPLVGCTLVDQRTFNPEAGKRPVVVQAAAPVVASAAVSGPTPLLRIPLGAGVAPADWAGPLRDAVRAARARKPDVAFDVVAVVPATGTRAEQAAAVEDTQEPAARIARDIGAAGVPAARIQLQARPVPDAAGREVWVFVR